MFVMDQDYIYDPNDDMYPGSSFAVSGLDVSLGRALAKAVKSLLPSGWEAEWESFTDSLEVRPLNAEVKGPTEYDDQEYVSWARGPYHRKIVNFVTNWLNNTKTASGGNMTPKFASKDADRVLARLDRIAATVQEKYASWGMPFETAKEIVNAIDKTADEVELAAFGTDSLSRRQAEIIGGKTAKVVQRDADEKYMDTFKNPMQPHQVESDEPYMAHYGDDQSSAVGSAQSTSGRKLAPSY